MRSGSRGFTLVEMITVLAIATILIGTATWQVQRVIVAQRSAAAARRFVIDVRSAASVAARRNAPVQITVGGSANPSCSPSYTIDALAVAETPAARLETVCLNAEYPGIVIANPVAGTVSCAADGGMTALPNCSLCTGSQTITVYPTGELAATGTVGDTIVFAPRDLSANATVAVGVRDFSGRTRIYTPNSGGGWSCP